MREEDERLELLKEKNKATTRDARSIREKSYIFYIFYNTSDVVRLLFVLFNKTPQSEIKNRGKQRVTCTSFMLPTEESLLHVTLGLFHNNKADREAIIRDRSKTW
jgi:hypothetical protein